MDKQKLVKAGMWLSVTVMTIAIDANLLMLGFNHEKNSEAIKMESLELKILKNLGYRLDSLRNEKNENL